MLDSGKGKRDPKTYEIIGAAMEVHRTLGPGFLELVYHEALAIEFQEKKIPYEHEVSLPVYYKTIKLHVAYRADFICFGDVLVELKAISQLGNNEKGQIINYLKATGLQVGLLLNFGSTSLQYERVIFG